MQLSMLAGLGGGTLPSTIVARSSAFFNGTANADYYTYAKGAAWASWVFPDADWALVLPIQATYSLATGAAHLANIGSFGAAGLVALFYSGGTISPRLNARINATVSTTITQAADFTPDQGWWWIVIRRVGSNVELLRCSQSGTVESLGIAPFASPAAITPNGLTSYVGARSDQNVNSFYQGNISYLAKFTGTMTDAMVQQLAAGTDPSAIGLQLDVYTKFDGSASVTDSSGNGKTATRVGSPVARGGPSFAGLPIDIDSSFQSVYAKVWQRSAGGTSRTITFSGTFRDSPAGIECRVVDAAGTQVVAWTAATLSRAARAWSCPLTVPQGANYTLEARHADNTAKVQRTWMPWGVGAVVLYAGQSNMVNQFISAQTDISTATAPALVTSQVSLYDSGWSNLRSNVLPAGGGALSAAIRLNAALGIPVALIDGAKTGSAVVSSAPDNWSFSTGSPYVNFQSALAAAGGDAELLLWGQGEADADNSIDGPTYQAALSTVLTNLRASVGRTAANLPVGLWMLGHRGSVEQGTWNAIRTAHRNLLSSVTNCFFLGTPIDLPLADQLHYVPASYETLGKRFARAILHKLLPGTFTTGVVGPAPASASFAGNVITVTFTLTDGTALQGNTGATGLTGFTVKNGAGVVQTISATAIPTSNTIALTMASPPSAGWTVDYCGTALATTTNMVYANGTVDGDTLGLPAFPTTAPITL